MVGFGYLRPILSSEFLIMPLLRLAFAQHNTSILDYFRTFFAASYTRSYVPLTFSTCWRLFLYVSQIDLGETIEVDFDDYPNTIFQCSLNICKA